MRISQAFPLAAGLALAVPGTVHAQTPADTVDIQIAAIASLKLSTGHWRVIFDNHSMRYSQQTPDAKRLLDRFHFVNATPADLAKCGSAEHACAVLPDSTLLIDVSDLAVTGTKATITVRSTSAMRKRDGTPATNSSMLTVMLSQEKTGWKVTGEIARASDVGGVR